MRKYIFFICGLTLSLSAIAQTSVSASRTNFYYLDNVLIREYNYPETITSAYSNEVGGTVFSYDTITHAAKDMVIPNCIVRDFVIDNDTVFFCGQYSGLGGCIGFFDINDFFFGSGWFSLCFQWGLPDERIVEDLTKLVTYTRIDPNDQHYRHIVSIGYEKYDSLGCIVDALLDGFGYVVGSTGYVNYSGVECFRDIALVGDHLVTTGFENGPYITMRLYDRSNALYSGLQNSCYTFDNFNQCEEEKRIWKTKDILITPVSNKLFATASVEHKITDDYYEREKDRIMVAGFKKYQIEGHYVIDMTLSSELLYANHHTITNLYGFVFSTTHSTYGLLSNAYNNKSLFLELNSSMDLALNSLSAYTGVNACQSKGLQGLDLYDGGDRYVMSGRCSNNGFTQTYLVETVGHQSQCLPSEDVEIHPFCKLLSHTAYVPFTSFGYVPQFRMENAKEYLYFDINIDCEAGEE